MGKIKKVASSKHEATISSFLSNFIDRCTKIPVSELPAHLASFPRSWPFPRGDVYHWIGVLNHFDEILNAVIEQYNLQDGPQTKSFGVEVLLNSFDLWRTEQATPETEEERLASVKALGYGLDGDRELVESILTFSQLLQEKCGNRSLYNSSDRLSCFLNTTSDALLITTLRLALTLAQRYHARQRTANSQHLQQSLLAAHYNIDLEKVQKLASPFSRPTPLGHTSLSLMSPSIAASFEPSSGDRRESDWAK
jgi:E3 ubiquitin-protein ligase HUWE1